MRSRKVALLVSLAFLLCVVLAAQLPTAGAQAGASATVILIEVDGLEPKDVTPETTPFLWELAHPENGVLEGTRAGWAWQAPRATMTAGTAANSVALLTGGYPEQVGVPADEFVDEDGTTQLFEHRSSDEDPAEDAPVQITWQSFEPATLLNLVQTDSTHDYDAAAFVGNPALSGIVDDGEIPTALKWWPTNTPSQSPPSPAYCDAPRRPPEDPNYQPPCSATDLVTLDHAATQLASSGENVAFTYIHLAELGVIKRRDGDFSAQTPPTELESPEAAQTVPHQLAQTDAAIAQFMTRYQDEIRSRATAEKWPNTFVFVVGSHGYETSTPDKRLPAPGGQVGSSDLETWVERDGIFKYSSYGSMATIQAPDLGDPAARRQAIAGIVDDLKPGGSVDQACRASAPAGDTPIGPASCIQELLYVRDDVAPATLPEGTALLSKRHPNWHVDHLNLDDAGNRTQPSRRSGELLLVTKPGWGAGAVASVEGQEDLAPSGARTPDPYLGVAGGPRNRAVVAIVNGPSGDTGVKQVEPRRYPVTETSVDCNDAQNPRAKYSLAQANADPEDDTGAVGYACQPENVDFAPTIGALLQVGIDTDQLGGRFLQEAFRRSLEFPGIEELVEPPPPPPPKKAEVVVLPPPPPPDAPPPPRTWRYSGLLRNVAAGVGDRRGNFYPYVRRGAKLHYLILKADFGKPLAAVKLTFYRRAETDAQSSRRRTVVKTLATFKPFTVRRAKRARLKLKVPEIFKPTHVGVIVRRARPLTDEERTRALARAGDDEDVPGFKAYGDRAGGIYRVGKARRLHTRATDVRRRRTRG